MKTLRQRETRTIKERRPATQQDDGPSEAPCLAALLQSSLRCTAGWFTLGRVSETSHATQELRRSASAELFVSRLAWLDLGDRYGHLVLADMVNSSKQLKGVMYGGMNPRASMPMLLSMYQAGALKLDELVVCPANNWQSIGMISA